MASIKKYFRNTLIGLATMLLASLSVNNQTNDDKVNKIESDDDFHMFI